MSFTSEQIEMLRAPLGKQHVKSRSQAGRSLSYIEGWHAIDEANRIFGFDRWDRQTKEMKQLCEPYKDQKDNWRVAYMARVRIKVSTRTDPENPNDFGGYIWRDGCGYGSGIDKDLGSAHESAIKEAETDAMKRALMTFGNPFGLALYDKEQRNVMDETPAQARAYVSLAKTAMQNADTPAELDQWWKDEATNRDTYGIKGGKDTTGNIVGTPEYMELVKAFQDRKGTLLKRDTA